MKNLMCPECGKRRTVDDKVVIKWCVGCMEVMQEIKKEEKDDGIKS